MCSLGTRRNFPQNYSPLALIPTVRASASGCLLTQCRGAKWLGAPADPHCPPSRCVSLIAAVRGHCGLRAGGETEAAPLQGCQARGRDTQLNWNLL